MASAMAAYASVACAPVPSESTGVNISNREATLRYWMTVPKMYVPKGGRGEVAPEGMHP